MFRKTLVRLWQNVRKCARWWNGQESKIKGERWATSCDLFVKRMSSGDKWVHWGLQGSDVSAARPVLNITTLCGLFQNSDLYRQLLTNLICITVTGPGSEMRIDIRAIIIGWGGNIVSVRVRTNALQLLMTYMFPQHYYQRSVCYCAPRSQGSRYTSRTVHYISTPSSKYFRLTSQQTKRILEFSKIGFIVKCN